MLIGAIVFGACLAALLCHIKVSREHRYELPPTSSPPSSIKEITRAIDTENTSSPNTAWYSDPDIRNVMTTENPVYRHFPKLPEPPMNGVNQRDPAGNTNTNSDSYYMTVLP